MSSSRKKRFPKDGPRPWYGHWGWLALGGVLVVVGGVALFAPGLIDRRLESAEMQTFMGRHTAGELDMAAGYLPLTWSGLEVTSPGMEARSLEPGRMRELRAHEMRAVSSLTQLTNQKVRVKSLMVEHLELAFGEAAMGRLDKKFPQPPVLVEPDAESANTNWDTEIEKLEFKTADLVWGQEKSSLGGIWGTAVQGERVGEGHYRITGSGGTMRQHGWPELKVRSFVGAYEDKTLTIDASELVLGEKDQVTLTGRICDGDKGMELKVVTQDCAVGPFLGEEMRGKLRGRFRTEAAITRQKAGKSDVKKRKGGDEKSGTDAGAEGEPGGKKKDDEKKASKRPPMETEVAGKLVFKGAAVRKIAALERAAEFTKIDRFRDLELDVLEGDYLFRDGRLKVEDFVMEAKGLTRVTGSFTVKGESINATLQLGVSAKVLESFPGAEGAVFQRSGKGGSYYWTTLHLSGSLDHPDEDLKERLVAAAKAHYAKKILGTLLKPGSFVLDALQKIY